MVEPETLFVPRRCAGRPGPTGAETTRGRYEITLPPATSHFLHPLATFPHPACRLHPLHPHHRGGILMRTRHALVVAATAGSLAAVIVGPAQAAEYSSALKIRGVQYDAPGRDSNSCTSGNTTQEYLTVKNYSKTATINLKNYVVKDATGNRFKFTANHYLQPGDYVKLRGGAAPTPTRATSSTATTATSSGTTTRTRSTCTSRPAAAPTCTRTPSPATTATATGTSASTSEPHRRPLSHVAGRPASPERPKAAPPPAGRRDTPPARRRAGRIRATRARSRERSIERPVWAGTGGAFGSGASAFLFRARVLRARVLRAGRRRSAPGGGRTAPADPEREHGRRTRHGGRRTRPPGP